MKQSRIILLAICFIGVSIAIGTYIKTRKSKLLSNDTSETYAIYQKTAFLQGTGPMSYFSYSINHVEYELGQKGRYSVLKKGDTVIIKYSNSDHSVAEVIDPKPDWDEK